MKRLNTKGFTVIAAFLVVVVVASTVGVGFYVYNSNKSEKKPIQQNSQSTTSANSVKYSEFKELSVKVPADQIAGIKSGYTAPDQNNPAGYYVFYTDKEREYATKCFGESGKDSSTISIAKSSGKYGDSPLDGDFNTLVKQYDGFYITSTYGKGAGCDGDQAAYQEMLKEQDSTRKKVEEAFKQSANI